jgi:hypothetical protein
LLARGFLATPTLNFLSLVLTLNLKMAQNSNDIAFEAFKQRLE